MAPEVRSHWEITWCKHSVYFSIGEAKGSVKLLEEIVSVFSPQTELSSTTGGMDPAGFEPASATVTECCVPFTPRALNESSAVP
jgi:hypothetical protein